MGDADVLGERDRVRINEIFGPTIQGEGPYAGRNALFLRLAGCNLSCSWCDTPFTWDWTGKNGTVYSYEDETHACDDVWQRLVDAGLRDFLVVTGGEPLIQRRELSVLVARLMADGIEVQIETNGTRLPLDRVRPFYVVSPKLANAGMTEGLRLRRDALAAFGEQRHAWKFVATCGADLDEVASIVPEGGDVWIMPEGRDPETILRVARTIADDVIKRGWHLSLRSHVLLWGDERCR